MKLYDYQLAPNPRRVRIFLAEKGITVPTVQVDLRSGEQFTPEFRAINPECTVPVLEFDDGGRIAEVIAICLYFELVHPEPALMGVGAQDRANVAARHHGPRSAGPGRLRANPGARRARPHHAVLRDAGPPPGGAPVRRQRALHNRRHLGARDGQLRLSDQSRDPGRLQPSATLARERFGASERRRLIAGSSSDRLSAACEELIFDRQRERRLETLLARSHGDRRMDMFAGNGWIGAAAWADLSSSPGAQAAANQH